MTVQGVWMYKSVSTWAQPVVCAIGMFVEESSLVGKSVRGIAGSVSVFVCNQCEGISVAFFSFLGGIYVYIFLHKVFSLCVLVAKYSFFKAARIDTHFYYKPCRISTRME